MEQKNQEVSNADESRDLCLRLMKATVESVEKHKTNPEFINFDGFVSLAKFAGLSAEEALEASKEATAKGVSDAFLKSMDFVQLR